MTNENGSPPGPDEPAAEVKTVNQIVAWNIAYYRRAAGLTQEQLGELTGRSKRNVSADETSWSGDRTREFDAHTLVGLAMALRVPLTALLLPPEDDGVTARYELVLNDGTAAGMADLMAAIMPDLDAGSAVLDAYRYRLARAAETYLAPTWARDIAGWLGVADDKKLNAVRAARLRGRLAVLEEMLDEFAELAARLEEESR